MIAESPALLSARPKLSRLHVVTLTPFFPTEGNETDGCFIAEPLPYLAQHGITNTVIAVSPFHQGRLVPLATIPSQRIHYHCIPGNWGLASSGNFLFRQLVDCIRELHRLQWIDLIHSHSALPCGHAARLVSRVLDIPYVVSVHGLDAFSTTQAPWIFRTWCKRATVRVYREAKQVLCVSRKVQDRVLTECPEAPSEVVHNGVDPDLFSPPAKTSDGINVLCVGNLIPTKGQGVLLRAFAEVRKKVPQVTLKFIGNGPEERHLRNLAGQLGLSEAVTFAGRQDRESVLRAMRDCTIFTLPSFYEGLGCVYLEAMSCSRPVIACRGQGIEDVIADGENGYLVPPHDHRALSETIIQLVQNAMLREQIGRRARQTIVGAYTLEQQAAKMIEAYREACG